MRWYSDWFVGTVLAMSEVTQILSRIESGDPSAAEKLLPLVYEELRRLAAHRMASESPDHTLQSTALVHEAYVRLVDGETARHWDSRGHFFAAAAEAMRRILIDRARDRQRLVRGGGRKRIDFQQLEIAMETPDEELIALDEALESLSESDRVCADLVKLRFFSGFSLAEAAAVLGISPRTADRQWAYARAWLFDRLGGTPEITKT